MTSAAKTAVALSVSGMILVTALAGSTVYKLFTDKEYFAQVDAEFEKIYGMTLEEYTNMLEEVYKTGEVPEEFREELERMGY